MWSFFARDPAKDFGYEVGELVPGLEDKSIWQLHKGKKKVSGQEVSIFVFELKGGNDVLLDTAKASVKRLKTLRHPNILQYIDSLETEKVVYLVTEYVEPLNQHLELSQTEEEKRLAVSWGLFQVAQTELLCSLAFLLRSCHCHCYDAVPAVLCTTAALRCLTSPGYSMKKGLGFLTIDCGLSHNNICLTSVFVDKAGEWKIGGVDYMCPATEAPPAKTLPSLDRYNPPELSGPSSGRAKPGPKWARDSWGLGCLIWEAFNGPLPKASALESPGKIPKPLSSAYSQLTNSTCNSRPSPNDIVTRCRSAGGFLKNSFVDTMLFIEEIQIKDSTAKNRFFAGLPAMMDNFPPNVCKYKILPQLINSFEFGDAGSSVLTPLFKRCQMAPTASSTASTAPTKTPTKRGRYSAIIREVESGRSQAEVAREFKISKQTVTDYIRNKTKIKKAAEKSTGSRQKNVSKGSHPKLEEALHTWLNATVAKRVPPDSESDSEDDAPAIVRPSNAELTQALMVLSSVFSDRTTLAEMQNDLIARRRNTVQQTIDRFLEPLGV
ncbi:hypothetical protein HPB47_011549 [Ixodes persulcatus]|uniref:Uncharacterized protein n=1 Tax=Ixodes persulcatus TaxID=34615 RepID=A0AC60NW01_IXOPE|nr:hypothetical protein HPB47_011549 [Ixodes persulcatus]